jgi:hypothetical protein
MDKRLAKRHKRQVSRAKERGSVSEPDVRTPEQVKADREASRAVTGRSSGLDASSSMSLSRGGRPSSNGSAAKTDV